MEVSVFLVPIVAIVGVFTFITVSVVLRARVRELEIRERIAMIEKGLVPPPEVDPRGFERAMRRDRRLHLSHRGGRHRSAGITLMAVGFGLMLLISVTGGAEREGVGVGGFLVIMGIGFLINSFFDSQQPAAQPPTPGTTDPRLPPPSES